MTDTLPPLRRVVTGHDIAHVAKVILDGTPTNVRRPTSGNVVTTIWSTDATPADIAIGDDIEDMGARKLGTPPPPHGTRFAVLDFPPGNKPGMHRTESLDYVIVLAGEIDMDMDESSVRLEAGDVMIQRGTNHSWVNRGTTTARVAFVLIDAVPLGIGHAVPATGTAS